jgi:hypothetical protein
MMGWGIGTASNGIGTASGGVVEYTQTTGTATQVILSGQQQLTYQPYSTVTGTHVISPCDYYVDDTGYYHVGLDAIYKAVSKRYFDKQMKEIIEEDNG